MVITLKNYGNCTNGATRTTTIHLQCFNSTGTPPAPTITRTDNCNYDIVINRLENCPLCTPADFYSFQGQCINSNRIVGFLKQGACYGGYVPPADTNVPCTTYEYTFPWYAIVIIALAFVASLGIVMVIGTYFAVRYRQTNARLAQYERAPPSDPALDPAPHRPPSQDISGQH